MKRTLVFMMSALALGACATDPVTGEAIWGNTGKGAAIGAIAGGIGGVFAGGNDGRNIAVGAAVGAQALAHGAGQRILAGRFFEHGKTPRLAVVGGGGPDGRFQQQIQQFGWHGLSRKTANGATAAGQVNEVIQR